MTELLKVENLSAGYGEPVVLHGAAPAEAAGDEDKSEAGDDSEQPVESLGESSIMMRLRMADPAQTAHRSAELAALRERMLDLRARLAKGVRRRAR